jgi:hypothetical protein
MSAFTGSSFTLADDGTGGTIITDPPKTASLVTAMASFGTGGAGALAGPGRVAVASVPPLATSHVI